MGDGTGNSQRHGLYNKKKERLPLPEWAAVKRKCDRFYF